MKKASPKAVGGFVIGAVLIGLIAVIVFGSGRIFEHRAQHVAFFTGSLQGLRLGAPVQFRGVEIGTVSEIYVQFNSVTLDFLIPVVLDINNDLLQDTGNAEVKPEDRIEELIEKGLRAQLAVQSFVTGQQVVQLALHPDTPVQMVETDLPYEQIPTIPSTFEAMEKSVGNVLQDISDLLTDLKGFVGDNRGTIEQGLANISETTVDAKAMMADLRKAAADIAVITETVNKNREAIVDLVDNANDTFLSYKSLAERAEAVVAENQDDLSKAISGLRQVEQKISDLAETANAILNENREGMKDFTNEGLYEIRNLAVDAQAAVEQFRRVMEEMERDPARFLLGQPGQVKVE
jgi:paraquat-inducible protein B